MCTIQSVLLLGEYLWVNTKTIGDVRKLHSETIRSVLMKIILHSEFLGLACVVQRVVAAL